MTLRTAVLALPIALVLAASFAAAQPEPAVPAAASVWSAQAGAMMKASLESKRGLVFYVDGQTIPGGVKEIGADFVIVANQEHGQVLIRLDRIDAVAAN